MDDAVKLQRAENRLCECGAFGSGEGHTEWWPAKKFDGIPENMTAVEAIRHLRLTE